MNKFTLVLTLALLPLSGHAQVVENIPQTQGETGSIIYRTIELDEAKDKGHFNGMLELPGAEGHGLILCNQAQMKAAINFNGEILPGYFDFESSALCDQIAQTMDSHPNMAVKFTVILNPAKRGKVHGYQGGEITNVQWLK